MCGRYALGTPIDVVAAVLGATTPEAVEPGLFGPRYNIAPTQTAPVVRCDAGGRRAIVPMRWGLVPFWAKDPSIGARMINARAETAAEKPAYRTALRRRRCLVPADGFYEWQRLDGRKTKQPWYIHGAEGESTVLALAGLWERWDDPDGSTLESFTIVTTAPNAVMRPLHDRMPVILPSAAFATWLDPAQQDPAALTPLLVSAADDVLRAHPVSTVVNSPRNEVPECREPAPPAS